MISLPDGNPQSGPDCCNLQSGCTQIFSHNNDLQTNPDCRGSDCRTGLQSEKHHKKSVTYSQFQIASALPISKDIVRQTRASVGCLPDIVVLGGRLVSEVV